MGNLFNPEAPLMQGLGKIADMMVLNVLTVLLSLPVVTAGAATAALYDATWRILQDEGSVYGAYFRAFKSNFKQATVLWLLTLASGALLLFCLLFLHAFTDEIENSQYGNDDYQNNQKDLPEFHNVPPKFHYV